LPESNGSRQAWTSPSWAEKNKFSSPFCTRLLIISESARRLGTEAEALAPGPPWRAIRDLGNVLRHAYDDVTRP
jgi:uncharacterized protein with HEPN domain